jgi:hypothetical protein
MGAKRSSGALPPCSAIASQRLVVVEKGRLQRHLRLDPSVAVVEFGPDRRRQRGIDVELAHILIPGSHCELHGSLGFEAFPGDAETSERLPQVVRRFLEACPALPPSADHSMSYPRWLLDLNAPV